MWNCAKESAGASKNKSRLLTATMSSTTMNACEHFNYTEDNSRWTCAICLIPAKFRDLLEEQYETFHSSIKVYYDGVESEDVVGDSWVICPKCRHTFHLKCVSEIEMKLMSVIGFECCWPNHRKFHSSNWTQMDLHLHFATERLHQSVVSPIDIYHYRSKTTDRKKLCN